MKEQIKTKLKVSDVIHHFANRVGKTAKSGDYSFNDRELYYDSRCIAKIISLKKKIVVIDNTFNISGAYGNGYSWWNVKNAFSDQWTILLYNNPLVLEYNIKDLYKVYFCTIKESVFSLVDKYQIEKELINNNLAYRTTYYKDHTDIFTLAKQLKLSENKIKRHIYNERHSTAIRYISWGKSEYSHILIDKPISFWLDESKWHTEKERKIFEFKQWKEKWINKGETYGKSYKEIFYNDELRISFETSTTTKLERIKKENERRKREEELRIEKKEKEIVEKWKNRELNYYRSFWHIPVQLRFNEDKTIVETTKGANVPTSHAERLFKFFIKCIAENKTYISNNNNHQIDSIGVYKLREINKNDKEEWYIKAGCHVIYKDAIDDFINRYNLNW